MTRRVAACLAAAGLLAGCGQGNPALPDPSLTIDPASVTVPSFPPATSSLVPPTDIE